MVFSVVVFVQIPRPTIPVTRPRAMIDRSSQRFPEPRTNRPTQVPLEGFAAFVQGVMLTNLIAPGDCSVGNRDLLLLLHLHPELSQPSSTEFSLSLSGLDLGSSRADEDANLTEHGSSLQKNSKKHPFNSRDIKHRTISFILLPFDLFFCVPSFFLSFSPFIAPL